jgi:hypothetical protein
VTSRSQSKMLSAFLVLLGLLFAPREAAPIMAQFG